MTLSPSSTIPNILLILTSFFVTDTRSFTLKMTEPPPIYPLARRQLIERARSIDPSLAKGESSGCYSSVGWSNRLGTVLTPVAIPDVYTADRPFYWNRIDVGCRMTVIKLSSGDLWVHSPVFLDESLIQALGELGRVRHVVSPNYEHVKYAKMWGEYYKDAMMWGCPGMTEREPEVRWDGEIPFGIRPGDDTPLPPEFWDVGEIQPLHVDCEVNPFTGKAFFNEVNFFHVASETLICTDTYWNYPGDVITNRNYKSEEEEEEDFGVWELAPQVERIPIGSKLWKFGMDKIYRPFYLNFMIKEDSKEDFQTMMKRYVVDGWQPSTLVPAHGDIVRGKALIRKILTKHFKL